MIYTKTDLVDIFRPIVEVNDDIQEWVSNDEINVPAGFLKLLSDLDFAIQNAGLKGT